MMEQMISQSIYYPDPYWMAEPEDLGLAAEEIMLEPEQDVQIHAWFFPRPKPVASLLFCHGNGGNSSHRLENVRWLVDSGR